MNKVRELKALIYKKYDTEAEFARAIGWPRQRLNKITSGRKEPTISEVNEISVGLDEPVQQIASFFLAK